MTANECNTESLTKKKRNTNILGLLRLRKILSNFLLEPSPFKVAEECLILMDKQRVLIENLNKECDKLTALLHERDTFIVNIGQWDDFVRSLPKN